MCSNGNKNQKANHTVSAWSKEDANTTLEKQAGMNQNIIRKWCFGILKMMDMYRRKCSIKKEEIFERFKTHAIFRGSIRSIKEIFRM